jgi:hypothetical protein
MHESVLIYRNMRYLKLSLVLVMVACGLYLFHSPIENPNGGTWLGYTLGTLAAGIMLWLAWYGVRKRTYRADSIRLEDWASAHIYLGLALVFISTLHSGFQFGLNIHTFLYFLMVIVVLSGAVGLYFYIRFPKMLAVNRRGMTTDIMLSQIADLDRELRSIALSLDDKTVKFILDAVQNTRIGGTLMRQLSGTDPDCPTSIARLAIEQVASAENESTRRQLLTRLTKKEDLLHRIRQDIRLRSLLQIWLYVHVPFTFAMLAALVAHVVVVFYYW